MSYTNIEQVRKHIGLSDTPGDVQHNYPVILPELDAIDLPGGGIEKGSVTVKAPGNMAPVYEERTPSGYAITLQHNPLIPGSVTAASNRSLSLVYRENIDYAVAYRQGEFTIIDDGSIPLGQPLSVWYYPFLIYEEGVDYTIDYKKGTIKRLSGGLIAPEQAVLVDYTITYRYLNDDTLAAAVTEADAVIEKEIDSRKEFGADPALQAAATYLAASFLCRIAATESLRGSGGQSSAVSAWMNLSNSFRGDYERLIKGYRAPNNRPSAPRNS